jgi:hypothetical protein
MTTISTAKKQYEYFLVDRRGYFFYALYSNSNFLGNPKEWALFTKSFGAALFHSEFEALDHKNYLISKVRETITENLQRYKEMGREDWATEYQRKTQAIMRRFERLTIYAREKNI